MGAVYAKKYWLKANFRVGRTDGNAALLKLDRERRRQAQICTPRGGNTLQHIAVWLKKTAFANHAALNKGQLSQPAWRPHIDGLRAVSVVSVVLYHIHFNQVPGGFIGVDIFFVISGFLISKVIYNDVASSGRFRIVNFYERRIRRIIPVFVVVTGAALVAGYFLLLPDEYAQLGKSVIYASGFAANIFFYLTSNYFGPIAETQPLLHYWSLGVEEQFYVAFPLFVLGCAKFAPRLLAPGIFIVAVFSFSLAEFSMRTSPAAAFYLAPQRAWELMAGSILALPNFPFPMRRVICEPIAAIGLGLILFSVRLYGPTTPFPGVTAGMPVIGAALVLLGCERAQTVVGRLLGTNPLRFVGLWSYSIYMVHWPLIVFCRQVWPDAGAAMNVAIVVGSIGLGGLSYLLVETPFRKPREALHGGRDLAWATVISIAALLGLGSFVYTNDGFAGRLPENVQELLTHDDLSAVMAPIWRTGQCFVSGVSDWVDEAACLHREQPSALLWGDSHAAHLYAPLSAFLFEHGIQLSQANMSSCAPILDFKIASAPNCQAFNEKAFDWIKTNRPDYVVLSAIWPVDHEEELTKIYNTIDDLASIGGKVIVIGNTPRYAELVPHILAKRLLHRNTDKRDHGKDLSGGATDNLIGRHYVNNRMVIYVSPKKMICENSDCPLAEENGMPLLADRDHFTVRGAEFAVRRMLNNPPMEQRIFGILGSR